MHTRMTTGPTGWGTKPRGSGTVAFSRLARTWPCLLKERHRSAPVRSEHLRRVGVGPRALLILALSPRAGGNGSGHPGSGSDRRLHCRDSSWRQSPCRTEAAPQSSRVTAPPAQGARLFSAIVLSALMAESARAARRVLQTFIPHSSGGWSGEPGASRAGLS